MENKEKDVRGYSIYEHRGLLKYEIVLDENDSYYDSYKGTELEGRHVLFETDEEGFLCPSHVCNDAILSLFFLGDSSIECTYVQPLKRYPYLVGKLLDQHKGLRVNSYNAGVSGMDTVSATKVLLNKIMRLNPEYLLFCNVKSELLFLLSDQVDKKIGLESKNTIVNRNEMGDISQSFSKRLIQAIKFVSGNRIHGIRNYFRKKPIKTKNEYNVTEKNTVLEDSIKIRTLNEFQKHLEGFTELCKAYEIKLILLTQANRYFTNESSIEQWYIYHENCDLRFDSWINLYKEANNIVRKVSRENGIPLIDLESIIEPNEKKLYDAVHYTDEGSENVAKIITDKIGKEIENDRSN